MVLINHREWCDDDLPMESQSAERLSYAGDVALRLAFGIDGGDCAAVDFGVASVAFDEFECDLVFAQPLMQLLPVFDIGNPQVMSASYPAFRCPSDTGPRSHDPAVDPGYAIID